MANYFDQFDQPKSAASSGGNFFDQFDEKPVAQQATAIERFNQPITDIANETGQILRNIPNQNPSSSALQILGEGAKVAALPIAAATSVAAPALQPVARPVANAIDSTSPGQWIGDKLLQAKDAISSLSQAHPELSKDISAGVNLTGTLVGGKNIATPIAQEAAPIIKDVAGSVGSAALDTANAVASPTVYRFGKTAMNVPKIGVTDTAELGAAAQKWYEAADQAGALLKPEAMQSTISSIKQKVLGSSAEEQAFGTNSVVDDYLKRLDNIANMPVTLKGLDGIDGKLQQAIGTAARAGDKETVSALKTMQNGLRNASTTVNPEDLVNPGAFQAWRNGDAVYSVKMKSQQIDNIIKNAYTQKVPSTGIQTGFRQLAKSIDKYGSQGWTKEEISAINEAAKSGLVTSALSTLGSKLMSGFAGMGAGFAGGGMIGVPVGLVAGEAAGFPLRMAANALQRSRGTQVQRLLGDRPAMQDLMEILQNNSPTEARKLLQKE